MRKTQSPTTEESTDFFETLSMTADHYIFHDDSEDSHGREEADNYALLNKPDIASEMKTTAIITLVLVLITSVALGIIIWRSLATMQGAVHANSTANSYEL